MAQEAQAGVAVAADHAVAGGARRRRAQQMAGAERQTGPACPRQHHEIDAMFRRAQPGHWLGVGPGPGLGLFDSGQCLAPGVV